MATLKYHKNMKTSKNRYVCDECFKIFEIRAVLILHKRQHYLELPHKCIDCGTGFISLCGLKDHVQLGTHKKKRKYYCDECPLSFDAQLPLLKHRVTHLGRYF